MMLRERIEVFREDGEVVKIEYVLFDEEGRPYVDTAIVGSGAAVVYEAVHTYLQYSTRAGGAIGERAGRPNFSMSDIF